MTCIKRWILFLTTAFIVLHINAASFVVVIDAGHGGKDVGALGKSVKEKDVNLAVATLLGEMIETKMHDVEVVYTRNTDKYLTLQERAQIANKAKGNLFISIHCNSVDRRNKQRKTINGASTYTLGLHKSDDNLEVAMRENSVISLENDYEVTYQGFDPNSTESYIIFEISQNAHMGQSVDFASRVQKEFVSTAGRTDRGVRQAGFLVLARTSMPAVLVELDFICNPTQEKFLGSKEGQKKLAKAVFNAFRDYKTSNDNKVAAVTKERPKKTSEDNKQKVQSGNTPLIESQPVAATTKGTVYKVQFLTASEHIKAKDSRFKGLKDVEEYQENGLYKYTYGSAADLSEAQTILKKVKKKFKEAFIVTFRDGKRIK